MLENTQDKAHFSWAMLKWCKRVRDMFDTDQSENEDLEPMSVCELDNFIDKKKYKEKWIKHVSTWRSRFNEIH